MFIKNIAYNSFFVVSLSSFGMSVMQTSQNAFVSVPSLSILWKSLGVLVLVLL
jgi:hypothetical protein